MSLIPCDSCHQRVPEKLAQVTWAWYRADAHRVAWRQRLCTNCFCINVLPLDKELDFINGLTCPACGINTDHDMDAVYVTAYLPGRGKIQLELPTCGPCAASVRERAQAGAEKLEDREASSRGQDQAPSPTSPVSAWAEMGIPREPLP
jgi:hypothetical protein